MKKATKKSHKKSILLKASIIVTITAAVLISGCGKNPSDTSDSSVSFDSFDSSVSFDSSESLDPSDSSSYEEEENEIISFEGIKLSQLTQIKLNEYIDFTIPYTWTFGRVDTEEEVVEEAIAVTGDNTVMTIFLKKVNVSDEKTLLSEEISNLNSTYPEYDFKISELFENEVAMIEGRSKQGDVKMYIAVIPKGEESVWVTYAYKSEDSLAELYFNSVISEMLQKK